MNRFNLVAIICFVSSMVNAAEFLEVTPAAPPGARGLVTVESNGITLDLQGLRPGQYEVLGRSTSDDVLVLGAITILDPEGIPESVSGSSGKEDSLSHQVQVVGCHAHLQLPQGLSVTDVRQVLVQDLGGAILLKLAR